MSSNPDGGKNQSHARRDLLLKIQSDVQKRWEESKVFQAEPGNKLPCPGEKFFGNFPYPYMNGLLHLGHAFSLSKLEFGAAYHRLCGSNVLLPFAFHCTGMPIKASADKLAREIQQYGYPPVFPAGEDDSSAEVAEDIQAEQAAAIAPDKFKSKKSKAAAKTGMQKFQWEIMRGFGLSDEEIAKFQDPYYWLTYFPPLAKKDLEAFGLGCDWRRSFVTTDMNPFYDAFVRWQMRKLKKRGKVVKDMRYTIYSPLDGQPCADHDRASGEGVQPQEYVLIKMEVIPPFPPKLKALEGKNVYLAAATLRPETMYGQTNCWVLPDGNYGAYEISDSDVFILTARSALNLAYQNLSRVPEKPTCLAELSGSDLIGLPLKSPLSFNEIIYALPMLTILTDKGTGIVTSVPSDSPDDYMALQALVTKPAFREKYGVKDEWVLPFNIIPIINIPEFGDKSAEKVCIDLKIKSQKDKEKLAEAKRMTYLKGFTDGVMIVGEYNGRKVQEAKPLIQKKLLEEGSAILYSEPEKKVMSRSGDECVVALTDQWYITYGETEWKQKALKCLENMNTFSAETRNGFEHTLGWLNQWACSRSFGLGTQIPWDEQFLVESLSDSTLYMAYYTIAHFLQNGNMYGKEISLVTPEQMTDEVWDYVFGDGPTPKSDIPPALLSKMKYEFEYWYPFDIRVSGKDLIQNHLTFSIYNHTALLPEHHWPRGFRCNGHLMLNSEKMSKSTGNFRTLRQAIEDFSSDATRFALADAGDGMDDANFVFETANAAILRLTKELAWMEEIIAAESSLRAGPPSNYADHVFANEINIAVKETEKSYSAFMFRDALKSGFYDLQLARDEYRLSCAAAGMNSDLLGWFMDVQTRLITPICPHYAEHVWQKILRKEGFAIKAGWPIAGTPDPTLRIANKYLQDSIVLMRKLLQKQESGSKKPKKGAAPSTSVESKLTVGLIYVNEHYDGWKEQCLRVLQSNFDSQSCSFAPDEEINEALRNCFMDCETNFKQVQKLCMPFIRFKKDEARNVGPQALNLKLPFGEIDVLEENLELIKRQLGLEHVEVLSAFDGAARARAGRHVSVLDRTGPSPGEPVAIFMSKQEFEENLQAKAMGAGDDDPQWGQKVFGCQKSPSIISDTGVENCQLLQLFCAVTQLGFDLDIGQGEGFVEGMLMDGSLLKLVLSYGSVEDSITSWILTKLLYSSKKKLQVSASDFWDSLLSLNEDGKPLVNIGYFPSYSILKDAVLNYGYLRDAPCTSESAVADTSDDGPPQNIIAWLRIISACCKIRKMHSVFSSSEAEDLLVIVISLFLDRQLEGELLILQDCLNSLILYFNPSEWENSCLMVSESISQRVTMDLNCLRIVDCITGTSYRSKFLRSQLALQLLKIGFGLKVANVEKILESITSINVKEKECDFFRLYVYLVLMDNLLFSSDTFRNKRAIIDAWRNYLWNCSTQVGCTDQRFYAPKVRNKASYLLEGATLKRSADSGAIPAQ